MRRELALTPKFKRAFRKLVRKSVPNLDKYKSEFAYLHI
jgi:hypothetical protein